MKNATFLRGVPLSPSSLGARGRRNLFNPCLRCMHEGPCSVIRGVFAGLTGLDFPQFLGFCHRRPDHSHTLGGSRLQAYVKQSGPFAFYQDAHVNPILSAMHPHSTLRWRAAMREFTGDELQQGILPPWVHDAVMRGKIPPMPQTHKVSFTLEAVGALRSQFAVQVCSPRNYCRAFSLCGPRTIDGNNT